MDLLRALVLGLTQGVTEFLPVSSSGHLVLVRYLFGWTDEGLSFDAALHLGTLVAVLVVFRQTWLRILRGRDRPLLLALVLGTIPAGLAGWFGEALIATSFRGLKSIGTAFLATGLLLVLAERALTWRGGREHVLTRERAVFVGIAQLFALLPGLSRSGVTIAAGLFLGLSRAQAVEFSFLLVLPITAAAGLEGLREESLLAQGNLLPLAVGLVTACASGIVAIRVFLRSVRTRSLLPYAVYLFVVGGLLLVR